MTQDSTEHSPINIDEDYFRTSSNPRHLFFATIILLLCGVALTALFLSNARSPWDRGGFFIWTTGFATPAYLAMGGWALLLGGCTFALMRSNTSTGWRLIFWLVPVVTLAGGITTTSALLRLEAGLLSKTRTLFGAAVPLRSMTLLGDVPGVLFMVAGLGLTILASLMAAQLVAAGRARNVSIIWGGAASLAAFGMAWTHSPPSAPRPPGLSF